jgi:hypothetical protein
MGSGKNAISAVQTTMPSCVARTQGRRRPIFKKWILSISGAKTNLNAHGIVTIAMKRPMSALPSPFWANQPGSEIKKKPDGIPWMK